MNIRRRAASLVLALCLAVSFSACGSGAAGGNEVTPEPVSDGGTMLCLSSSLNLTEDDISALIGIRPDQLLFTSITAVAVNCLAEGTGDSLLTLQPVSDFYAAHPRVDEATKAVTEFASRPLDASASLSMLVSSERPDLVPLLNDAIASLREDGTVDVLYETWVTAYAGSGRPEDAEGQPVMPSFAVTPSGGVPLTLRIGISGVLPPFDYVLDGGIPCGFNAAFFAALAEKLKANLVFVPVLPESKVSALLDDKIDVYFWHFLDVPPVCLATDPFLTVPFSLLTLAAE